MPAILDTPEHLDRVQTDAITPAARSSEGPLARPARPGFWRLRVPRLPAALPLACPECHAPVCPVSRPLEAPMDRLIREHPSLVRDALALF